MLSSSVADALADISSSNLCFFNDGGAVDINQIIQRMGKVCRGKKGCVCCRADEKEGSLQGRNEKGFVEEFKMLVYLSIIIFVCLASKHA